jgi:hypothetical protein
MLPLPVAHAITTIAPASPPSQRKTDPDVTGCSFCEGPCVVRRRTGSSLIASGFGGGLYMKKAISGRHVLDFVLLIRLRVG